MLSYASGPSSLPLLGETIGENLRRTVELHGDLGGSRGTASAIPGDVQRVVGAGVARGARAHCARRSAGGSRRDLVAESLRVGSRSVRDGSHWGDPRQCESGLPNDGAAVRTRSVWCVVSDPCPRVSGDRLRAHARRGPGRLSRASRGPCPRGQVGVVVERRRWCRSGNARLGGGDAPVRRPDQHPVHVGDDRVSQGRDALTPQHPQQRVLHRGDREVHAGGSRVHPGAVLPLFRHGARQPCVHDARCMHCGPRRGV